MKMFQVEPALDQARDQLILALDFPSASVCLNFLDVLEADLHPRYHPRWVKVGLELFLSEGKPLVAALASRGYQVFLDLKLHDIPNTVAGALRSILSIAPALVTLHASGGAEMLAAAAAAVQGSKTRLLAVTVLTSLDAARLAATGVTQAPHAQVQTLAQLAWQNGIPGVVCSPHEAASLRAMLPKVHLVVPGIRPAGTPSGDQQRTATPFAAIHAGASQLVVGRSITIAQQPSRSFQDILFEMARALEP